MKDIDWQDWFIFAMAIIMVGGWVLGIHFQWW
jgi:hypothetical protein